MPTEHNDPSAAVPPQMVETLRRLLGTERRIFAEGGAWWDAVGAPALAACTTRKAGEKVRSAFARAVSEGDDKASFPPPIGGRMLLAWMRHTARWEVKVPEKTTPFPLSDDILATLREIAIATRAHRAECDALCADLSRGVDGQAPEAVTHQAMSQLRAEIGYVPDEQLPGSTEAVLRAVLNRQHQPPTKGRTMK